MATNNDGPYPYAAWQVGPWGACSEPCGGGVQTRDVYCIDQDSGDIIADSWCGGDTPSYSWQIGDWSTCSAPCGGGTQTRSVVCADSTGALYPDSTCISEVGEKPPVSQTCNVTPCSDYDAHWQVYPWGPCSEPCGGGTQSRDVSCIDWNSGDVVDDRLCE